MYHDCGEISRPVVASRRVELVCGAHPTRYALPRAEGPARCERSLSRAKPRGATSSGDIDSVGKKRGREILFLTKRPISIDWAKTVSSFVLCSNGAGFDRVRSMDAVRVLRTGTVIPAHFKAAGMSFGRRMVRNPSHSRVVRPDPRSPWFGVAPAGRLFDPDNVLRVRRRRVRSCHGHVTSS